MRVFIAPIAVPLPGGVSGGFSTSQVLTDPANHPMPVNSLVNLICEIANGGFVGMNPTEVLSSVERAGQEKRRVDGRQLTFPSAQPGVHVQAMVKPPSVTDVVRGIGTLGLFVESLQSPQNALATLLACDPTVVNANPYGRQPKTDGGDATIRVGARTVADQSVRRVGFEPEVIKCLSLKKLEKIGVV